MCNISRGFRESIAKLSCFSLHKSSLSIMRNVEIKAKVANIAELRKKAEDISKSTGTIIKQEDTFFGVEKGRLKLREFENGDAELISYDRASESGPKVSDYDKAVIKSPEVQALKHVLIRALGTTGVVKKTRELFMVDNTRVHVDTVQGLGTFMELEVKINDDQTIEEGRVIALKLMNALGINDEDLLQDAYTDLLKRK